MANLVEFQSEDGLPVFIELDQDELSGGEVEISASSLAKGIMDKAKGSFESALETINTVSSSVVDKISNSAKKPDEVEVEFGIKFSAKAGAFLANAGSEAHLNVKLTWKSA